MEKFLYLFLDIFSFIIPFAYSFERKKLHFIRYWKPYFLSIFFVGIVFILWDIYFTKKGVWGFNDRYLIGINFFELPLEEWLFFLLIPYSSNFIHYALLYFFPKPKLSKKVSQFVAITLFLVSTIIAIRFSDKTYTLWSFGSFSFLMFAQIIFKFKCFQRYFLSFTVIYIPFFVINSWLTGGFTPEPVVWYNNSENLGMRLGTIPLEDSFYCFTMLYSSLLLFEFLKSRFHENQN